MPISIEELTPTEHRMMQILGNGERHSIKKLRVCLNDDRALLDTVRDHVANLRKKLRKYGEDVALVKDSSGSYYQLVRLLKQD